MIVNNLILDVQIIILFIIKVSFKHDSYLAIILCEFPALLACIRGERSERHVKTGFLRLHPFYLCSTTHSTPSFHISKIYIYKIFIYIRTKYSYTKGQKLCWYWALQIKEKLKLLGDNKNFVDIFNNELFLTQAWILDWRGAFPCEFFIYLIHVWLFR